MLYGKSVVLGVSGGIAAYKSCELVSALKKLGAEVDVIMTANAEEFVTPLTFETLSNRKVVRGTFDEREEHDVKHVSLAKKADVFVVAPATANVIAKFAQGIADDMLSTTWLACAAPKVIAPAMNTAMYENAATQENIRILTERGVRFVSPAVGRLACGDVGKGKMAEPRDILDLILDILRPRRDLEGKTVLVTAGATEEYIDGVRVITNHSSGKMGCAIAEVAAERGAKVILVHGNMSVPVPSGVMKSVRVRSTEDMLSAVLGEEGEADVFIMSAAPSDYKLKKTFSSKIKSETLTLEFVKNPDIAKEIGRIKGERKLVVFSAETEDLIKNAKKKLASKNADFAVANDVTKEGAGFFVDTNIASLVGRNGEVKELGLMTKRELADVILDAVVSGYGA